MAAAAPVNGALLDEIRTAKGSMRLKKSLDATADGVAAPAPPPSATMLRGGLLNEIRKGKTLKKSGGGGGTPASGKGNATLTRGKLLHELKSKRPAVPSAGSMATGLHIITSERSQRPASSMSTGSGGAASASASTRDVFAAEHGAVDGHPVIKAGWLHKRGHQGIWQRRYFVLTAAALHYTNSDPRKGASIEELLTTAKEVTRMPMPEVHDIHPLGQGGEFCTMHLERRMRLRAPTVGEASAWVAALLGATLEAHNQKLPSAPSASSVVGGLVAPRSVQLTASDRATGEPLRVEFLPDALAEAATQLGEPDSVAEAVWSGAAAALESNDELEEPRRTPRRVARPPPRRASGASSRRASRRGRRSTSPMRA